MKISKKDVIYLLKLAVAYPSAIALGIFNCGKLFDKMMIWVNKDDSYNNYVKQELYLRDLEDRCIKANFAPYDDRLPVHDYVFEWDEYTIAIAENWLKEHNKDI